MASVMKLPRRQLDVADAHRRGGQRGCSAAAGFRSAAALPPRCPAATGSASSRCHCSRCVSSACTPLPIRLVVVSWPALSRKMQLCSSSSSLSRSPPTSPWISRVSTSKLRVAGAAAALGHQRAQVGLEVLDRGIAARQHRRAAAPAPAPTGWPATSRAAARARRAARRAGCRSPPPECARRSPRSGRAPARSCMRSSSPSTSATTPASMRAMACWLSAPTSSRRTRVCSGGSLNTRLLVWCSNSGESPNLGANSRCLSELARARGTAPARRRSASAASCRGRWHAPASCSRSAA